MRDEELIIWEEPKMRVDEFDGGTSVFTVQYGRHMITGELVCKAGGFDMVGPEDND